MPAQPREGNRGPAAAAENRRAILGAARRLFADRGYDVPLTRIAQAAGVGQAVLYRHFPSRLDLALAVFEENLADLETVAARPGPETFGQVWARLLEHTVEEVAFLEMFVAARRDLPDYDGHLRLLALVEEPLAQARAAGLVDPALTVDDVLLVQRMVYGVVTTATTADEVRSAVHRALALLAPRGLALDEPVGGTGDGPGDGPGLSS